MGTGRASSASCPPPRTRKAQSVSQVKVKILQMFIAPGGRKFTAGEVAEMDAAEAAEFQRAGFVDMLAREPAVKILNKPRGKAQRAVK